VGEAGGSRIDQSLSNHNEAKTKSALKPNQKIIPTGVMIIFSLFLVVAIRYKNSAYLSAKLINSLLPELNVAQLGLAVKGFDQIVW
jgi:hypothetical protein